MPESAHQLGECRAGGSRQGGPGMAKIMPAKIRTPGRLAGPVEMPKERRRCQLPIRAAGSRKQQRASTDPGMISQMPLELRQQMRRDRDVTHAST